VCVCVCVYVALFYEPDSPLTSKNSQYATAAHLWLLRFSKCASAERNLIRNSQKSVHCRIHYMGVAIELIYFFENLRQR